MKLIEYHLAVNFAFISQLLIFGANYQLTNDFLAKYQLTANPTGTLYRLTWLIYEQNIDPSYASLSLHVIQSRQTTNYSSC